MQRNSSILDRGFSRARDAHRTSPYDEIINALTIATLQQSVSRGLQAGATSSWRLPDKPRLPPPPLDSASPRVVWKFNTYVHHRVCREKHSMNELIVNRHRYPSLSLPPPSLFTEFAKSKEYYFLTRERDNERRVGNSWRQV